MWNVEQVFELAVVAGFNSQGNLSWGWGDWIQTAGRERDFRRRIRLLICWQDRRMCESEK